MIIYYHQKNLNAFRDSGILKNLAVPSSGEFISLSTGLDESSLVSVVLRTVLQFFISREICGIVTRFAVSAL